MPRSHASYVRGARRGWAQRGELIDHIVTVEVDSPKGGPGGGVRTTARDFVVPARPGTRKAELLWLIKEKYNLPRKERYAVDFLSIPGRRITVAEGPRTRGRKTKLR